MGAVLTARDTARQGFRWQHKHRASTGHISNKAPVPSRLLSWVTLLPSLGERRRVQGSASTVDGISQAQNDVSVSTNYSVHLRRQTKRPHGSFIPGTIGKPFSDSKTSTYRRAPG